MSKHTPGPWTYKGRVEGKRAEDAKYHLWGADKMVGTMLVSSGKPIAMAEADMRLIAAAPELVEALGLLLARLDERGGIDPIADEGPIEDARAALRKARKG